MQNPIVARHRRAIGALSSLLPGVALAAPTAIDHGDTAWMITATALVLQVLGIIEPNLLAAYSSNLFGITCVALVKIRHVRPYKRLLILESQVQTGVKLAS